ncbi:Ppx/GppA phosphatase family protein [Phaeovibrio sulfidiphilus]|uniref:Ppx/GppA phosphatase family protein n=1 Tax=Phaeovibrio sulfidiphilus TaxID=1220600 RepID=UPI00308454CD
MTSCTVSTRLTSAAGAPRAPDGGVPASSGTGTRSERPTAYGALDLGTNNCRLLVARPAGASGFQILDSFSRITRLGEGLRSSGHLSEAAMERTLDALKICAERLERNHVTCTRCVTTAACRVACNAADFVARVQEETGLELEIIPAMEEARLTLSGCLPLIGQSRPLTLLFDIGGGSTELTLARITPTDGGPVQGSILALASLPFGVVTIAEAVGGGHISGRIHDDIVAYVTRRLKTFDPHGSLRQAAREGQLSVLGTSGTVTTAGAIALDLPRYDRSKVDGLILPAEHLRAVGQRLLSMSVQERIDHPCIRRERADLVLAGSAILDAILNFWPAPEIRIADRGVREGLLTELMRPASFHFLQDQPLSSRPACVGETLHVIS